MRPRHLIHAEVAVVGGLPGAHARDTEVQGR
jgi:hypothetical protein